MKGFTSMTNEYRQKHYPDGYFESLKRSDAIGAILSGVVLALFAMCSGTLLVRYLMGTMGYSIKVLIVFIMLTLTFLGGAISFIVLGVKGMSIGKGQWIERCAGVSQYPVSTVQEFESQFMRNDVIVFRQGLTGVTTTVLTTDYILCGICMIKVRDIAGAYLVYLPHTISAGRKIRSIQPMHIAIISNHRTHILLQVRPKLAEHLLDLIAERHSGIDTAARRVLDEKEYRAMVEK